jgi:hypothetical protein
MDAAHASPVSGWMAVSREQNDHPLAPADRVTARITTASIATAVTFPRKRFALTHAMVRLWEWPGVVR